MFAAEQRVVVGQIAVADGKSEVDGYAVVVVVFCVVVPNPPCVASYHAVQPFYRAYKSAEELSHETRETSLAVVENEVRQSVGHLAYADAAHGCRHEVVDCGRLYFAHHFPHQASAERVWSRLPEAEAIAAGGVEIESSVVGMCEEVGGELVVVPHKAVLYVVSYSIDAYFSKLLVHHIAVKRPHEGVDAKHLKGGEPRTGWSIIRR